MVYKLIEMDTLNNLRKRILNKIGRDLITLFTYRKRNRILFMQESASGSNSYALWKLAGDSVKNKYELILAADSSDEGKGLVHFIKKNRLLASAQLIVTTHASYKPSKKHLHLQLWHGETIKKLGVMVKDGSGRYLLPKSWQKVDYIMSYSETYSTFLNACMVTDPNKYIITGAPRNDFMFLADGLSNLRKIFGDKLEGYKTIFFLPTYREGRCGKGQPDKECNNPFCFKGFLPEEFDSFLEKNKCKMVFKPHPNEEPVVLEYFRNYPLKNMLILRDSDLVSKQLDLYELLNACEILITDYSSIFCDYLLLDKPMIFTPVDIDAYKEARGFLVESFESWTPGPKVLNQDALQKEIGKCFADKDYYALQREGSRNLHHRYKDGESSERLWEFIGTII